MNRLIFVVIASLASSSSFAKKVDTTEVICSKTILGTNLIGTGKMEVMVLVQREFPTNKLKLIVAADEEINKKLSGDVKKIDGKGIYSVEGTMNLTVKKEEFSGETFQGRLQFSDGRVIENMECSVYVSN